MYVFCLNACLTYSKGSKTSFGIFDALCSILLHDD